MLAVLIVGIDIITCLYSSKLLKVVISFGRSRLLMWNVLYIQ